MKAETGALNILKDLGVPKEIIELITSMIRFSPEKRPNARAVQDSPAFDLLDQLSVLTQATPTLTGLSLANAYTKTQSILPEFYKQYVAQIKTTYSRAETI